MSSDSRPLLPRTSADHQPDHELRLRSDALLRVQRDEQSQQASATQPATLTRRSTISGLALLVAGASPVAGAMLRAPAASPSGQTSSGGQHVPAPMYGAPPPRRQNPSEASQSDAGNQQRPAPLHNGLWWNDKSSSYKEGFIVGYKSGEQRASTHPVDLKPFHSSEFIDGIDKFYKDFRNRSILVDDALPYVVEQLSGAPDDKLATELRRLRAAAAARGTAE